MVISRLGLIESKISWLVFKSSIGAINKPAPNNKKQQPQADPNKVYDIAIGDSYTMGNKTNCQKSWKFTITPALVFFWARLSKNVLNVLDSVFAFNFFDSLFYFDTSS